MVQGGLLLVLVAAVGAFREIDFKNCKPSTGTVTCKVKAVEISGCLDPSSWVAVDGSIVEYQDGDVKRPCRIDSGSSLNFSISFEPGFSVDTIRSQFTLPDLPDCWNVVNDLDSQCPITEPPHSGCSHTKCPLQANRQQLYETTLQVNRAISSRPVNYRKITQMRWKLWNNKNKKHNCCLNIPVQY